MDRSKSWKTGRQNRISRWQWYVRGWYGRCRVWGRFGPGTWALALCSLGFRRELPIGPTTPTAASRLPHRRKSASVLRAQPIASSHTTDARGLSAAVENTEVNLRLPRASNHFLFFFFLSLCLSLSLSLPEERRR